MEENTFKDEHTAQEWISAIETIDTRSENARVTEVYPYLKNWIQKVSPGIVAEIGAGQGICSEKLGDFRGRYIGIEPSKYLLKRAEELYGSIPNCEFVEGEAYSLPLGNHAVDAAFSVCVWFHLDNLNKAAEELSRILKPGGAFLIITSNPEARDLWCSFFKELKEEGEKLTGTIELDGGTIYNIIHLHSLEDLTMSLRRSGLRVEKTVEMGYSEKRTKQGIFIAIQGVKSNA